MVVRQDSSFDTYGSHVRAASSDDDLNFLDRYSSKWVPEASSNDEETYTHVFDEEETIDSTTADGDTATFQRTYEYASTASFGTDTKSSFNDNTIEDESEAEATRSVMEPSCKQIYDIGTVANQKIHGTTASTKPNPLPFGQRLQALKDRKNLKHQELLEMTSTIGSFKEEIITKTGDVQKSKTKRSLLRVPVKKATKMLKWKNPVRSSMALKKIEEGKESTSPDPQEEEETRDDSSQEGLPAHLKKIAEEQSHLKRIAKERRESLSQSKQEGRQEPEEEGRGRTVERKYQVVLSTSHRDDGSERPDPPNETEPEGLEKIDSFERCEPPRLETQDQNVASIVDDITIEEDVPTFSGSIKKCESSSGQLSLKKIHFEILNKEDIIPEDSVEVLHDDNVKPEFPRVTTQLSVLSEDNSIIIDDEEEELEEEEEELLESQSKTKELCNMTKSLDCEDDGADEVSRTGSTVFAIRKKLRWKGPLKKHAADDRTVASVFKAPRRKNQSQTLTNVVSRTQSECVEVPDMTEQETCMEQETSNPEPDSSVAVNKTLPVDNASREEEKSCLESLPGNERVEESQEVSDPTTPSFLDQTAKSFTSMMSMFSPSVHVDAPTSHDIIPVASASREEEKNCLDSLPGNERVEESQEVSDPTTPSFLDQTAKSFTSMMSMFTPSVDVNAPTSHDIILEEEIETTLSDTFPETEQLVTALPTQDPVDVDGVVVRESQELEKGNRKIRLLPPGARKIRPKKLLGKLQEKASERKKKMKTSEEKSVISMQTFRDEQTTFSKSTVQCANRAHESEEQHVGDDLSRPLSQVGTTPKVVAAEASTDNGENVAPANTPSFFPDTAPSMFQRMLGKITGTGAATESVEDDLSVTPSQVGTTPEVVAAEVSTDSGENVTPANTPSVFPDTAPSMFQRMLGKITGTTGAATESDESLTADYGKSNAEAAVSTNESFSESSCSTARGHEIAFESNLDQLIEKVKKDPATEDPAKIDPEPCVTTPKKKDSLDLTSEETEALLRSWRKADQRRMMKAMDKVIRKRLREIELERQQELEEMAEIRGICCAAPVDFSY